MYNTLQHHGILGQKWGVRRYQNPDGSLTEAGVERYQKKIIKSLKKNYTDKDYSDFAETTKGIHAELKHIIKNNDVQKAREDLEKANKLYRDFIKNDKLREEYATYAGIITGKQYNPEDIDHYVWAYKYDDLDQGTGNSFSLYCLDKGTDIGTYSSKVDKVADNYYNTVKSKITDLLGKHANDPIKQFASGGKFDAKYIVESAVNSMNDVHYYVDGWMTKDQIPYYKKELEEAKKEYDRYKNVSF